MKSELAILDKVASEIERVATIGEAKGLADRAAAIRVFARKSGWSEEQRTRIAEIEIRAMVRLGQLLGGNTVPGGNRVRGRKYPLRSLPEEVTKKQSHKAQLAAEVPTAEREEYIRENKPKANLSLTGLIRIAKEIRRETKRREDAKQVAKSPNPESLSGVFSTIIIDPPWDFGDEGDVDQFGRGRPDYATMPIEDIAKLPVADRAAKNAHLYLWITNRSLPKGFALLERWDFRYVTCLTWCKPSIGMGNYFRGSTEQVLFSVRGSLPLKRKDVGTWFEAPRPKRGHSGKPTEFYEIVESCSDGPYLEMFSRSSREGWTHWGNNARV